GDGRAGQSPTLLGDMNNDGIVDIRDYGVWRQNFGQVGCGNVADLDGNCIVDVSVQVPAEGPAASLPRYSLSHTTAGGSSSHFHRSPSDGRGWALLGTRC